VPQYNRSTSIKLKYICWSLIHFMHNVQLGFIPQPMQDQPKRQWLNSHAHYNRQGLFLQLNI